MVNYEKQAQKYCDCFETCTNVGGRVTLELHAVFEEPFAKWEYKSIHFKSLQSQQKKEKSRIQVDFSFF